MLYHVYLNMAQVAIIVKSRIQGATLDCMQLRNLAISSTACSTANTVRQDASSLSIKLL